MKLIVNENENAKNTSMTSDEYYRNQISIIMDSLFTLMREADTDGRYKLKSILSQAYDKLDMYIDVIDSMAD